MSNIDEPLNQEQNDGFMSKTIKWAKENPWKALIVFVCCLVAIVAIVVVLIVVSGHDKRKKEKLSEGVDEKESFIFTNDGTSEFAYVQSYLNTSLGNKLSA